MTPATMRVEARYVIDSDAHHLEGVDLLVDAHRADLRGSAGADGGGERHTRRRRRDETHVEKGPQKAGQGFDADVGQGVVALHGDQRAGGQA